VAKSEHERGIAHEPQYAASKIWENSQMGGTASMGDWPRVMVTWSELSR